MQTLPTTQEVLAGSVFQVAFKYWHYVRVYRSEAFQPESLKERPRKAGNGAKGHFGPSYSYRLIHQERQGRMQIKNLTILKATLCCPSYHTPQLRLDALPQTHLVYKMLRKLLRSINPDPMQVKRCAAALRSVWRGTGPPSPAPPP